jgi:hypothetical protein
MRDMSRQVVMCAVLVIDSQNSRASSVSST